eukprot:4184214-Pyramimonas_sp.AAC.1
MQCAGLTPGVGRACRCARELRSVEGRARSPRGTYRFKERRPRGQVNVEDEVVSGGVAELTTVVELAPTAEGKGPGMLAPIPLDVEEDRAEVERSCIGALGPRCATPLGSGSSAALEMQELPPDVVQNGVH